MPLRRTLAEEGSLPPNERVRRTRILTREVFDRVEVTLAEPAEPDQAMRALVASGQAGHRNDGGEKK